MGDVFDEAAKGDVFDQAAQSPHRGFTISDSSSIPNARIRNMPRPDDPSQSPGRNFYEGAKTGLMLGSIPASAGQPIAPLARGVIGATLGGYGAKKVAKAAGAGDFGQEVAGDVGGLAGGGLAAELPGTKVGQSVAAVAKPFSAFAEDLPVVGSAIKGMKAAGTVRGELADIWAKKPTYPGAPLPESPGYNPGAPLPEHPGVFPGAPNPETPDPDLLRARSLFEGASSPPDPSAGLGKIPVRGSIAGAMADSVKAPAAPTNPPFERGNLGRLLNESVGAAPPPDPKAPIYQRGQIAQQMKAPPASEDLTPMLQKSLDQARAAKAPTDVLEGHTAHQSSALRSSKYDTGANEFHARMTSGDTTYVYGDVAPEEAQAFADADSKGKAYQQLKNGHPLVAKIVGGKRIAVKPTQ